MVFGERFYQMTNAIFCYDLTPVEFVVYSCLVCCTGQKDKCWPSNCSENTVRKADASLTEKRFIRKTATYEDRQDGRTNNTYYILDLPPVRNTAQSAPAKTYRQIENTGPPRPAP